MSNTPSNAEAWDLWLESITGGHHPASLAKFARAVLAKWGSPQPVVREPLTDEQIVGVMHSIPINAAPSYHIAFARAIEQAHGIGETP